MTKLATMGTSSCAAIAIQGFKPKDLVLEEEYTSNPIGFELRLGGERSVQSFYDCVLYPTKQDLGRTGDYPFSLLMSKIDQSSMDTKFIIATLNAAQMHQGWPKLLEDNGFQLIDKTKNTIGELCYIFVRNNNRPVDMTGVTPITPGTWGDYDEDDDDDDDIFGDDDDGYEEDDDE